MVDRPAEIQEAATIIDRLLCLVKDDDYNAVRAALLWLRAKDRQTGCLRLTIATRDRMEAAHALPSPAARLQG